MRHKRICIVLLLATPAFCQSTENHKGPNAPLEAATPKVAADLSVRSLDFKLVKSPIGLLLSPVTGLPQCDSNGVLFLDMLDPDNLAKHSLVSIEGSVSQSYSLNAINDLHDVQVFGFYPSESIVAFAVRATKEALGSTDPSKSPAGAEWSSYHNYVAEFDRNGTYKKSIELPMDYMISNFGIFESGEILIAGYDQVNSAARLIALDPSGKVLKSLDWPAGRTAPAVDAPYGSAEAARASGGLMGSISFTPYNQKILVWQRESVNPILEVSPGGRAREVQLESIPGLVFVGLVSANDRWVAHFRREEAPKDVPYEQNLYSYYEVRPQDGTLTRRLKLTGETTNFIACESSGRYVSYKMGDKGALVLFAAE